MSGLTAAVFTAPLLLSLFLDTLLLLWAERRARARMIALGLFGMGVSLVCAGAAESVLTFGAAFALFALSSGLACGLAQAALMDLEPERREENMAQWALAGTLGDLFAPLCIALAVWFSGTHRAAYFAVGAGLVALAPLLAGRSLPGGAVPDGEGARESLKSAFSNRALVLWLAGVGLCGLLDEVLAAFGALWLRERFSNDPAVVVKALGACTLGAVIGLFVLKPLLGRFTPRALLALSSAGSLVSHVAWLQSPSVLAASLSMGALGLFVAWQYPLVQAQAYRVAGERSGLVAALAPVVTSFELVAPLVLGLVADRFGLTVAVLALIAQPVGLLLILAVHARARG